MGLATAVLNYAAPPDRRPLSPTEVFAKALFIVAGLALMVVGGCGAIVFALGAVGGVIGRDSPWAVIVCTGLAIAFAMFTWYAAQDVAKTFRRLTTGGRAASEFRRDDCRGGRRT